MNPSQPPHPDRAVRPDQDRPRFFQRLWRGLQPAQPTRRATSWSSAIVAVALGGFAGTRLMTGWGTAADAGIGAGIALLLVLVLPLLLLLAAALARSLPKFIGYGGVGAFLALTYLLDEFALPSEGAPLVAGGIVVLCGLVFGALAAVASGRFNAHGVLGRIWIALCGTAGLVGTGWLVVFLIGSGSDEHIVVMPALADAAQPAQIAAPNPGEPGAYPVLTLTYGSGDDLHRPEYGEGVELRTESVNGKPFVTMPTGWKGDLRESYWGFGAGELPLNGRVWYPDGDGPFPIALVVHGNHHMGEYSDPGYAYLGELLASRGIVLVSVDENFLNGGGPAFGSTRRENDCRAWILLEHLRTWREWNATAGNPFFGKVDLDRVGLIGHSRGGEAVSHAALFNTLASYPDDASVTFDYGFGIRGVVAIAPSDGQYKPAGRPTAMRDVSYFTIHGGHDADVSSFVGDRLYRRLRFSGPGDWFKSTLYVYRANHGQFNTVWGPTDVGPPRAWLLNRKALLAGEQQRQIAKVYIGAFFEASLLGRREYVALFRDHRAGREWLPDALLVNRYEDPSFRLVADFEEDVDLRTASVDGGSIVARGFVVRREGDIPLRGSGRREDNGVVLGWNTGAPDADEPAVADAAGDAAAGGGETAAATEASGDLGGAPAYEIRLPEALAGDYGLGPDTALVFAACEAKEKPRAKDYSVDAEDEDEKEKNESDDEREPLDFSIELVARDGTAARVALSSFGALAPPLEAIMTRTDWTESRYGKTVEPVLQTFELPLSAFTTAAPAFRPEELATIRFVFDRSEKGVVILDRIGFANAR